MSRVPAVILGAILAAAPTSAQWLETVIDVPESLCSGITGPKAMAFCPLNGKVYVGGEPQDCIVALDGLTGRRSAKLACGSNVMAMVYASGPQKLYSADRTWPSQVSVIDVATDSLLRTVDLGYTAAASMCYSEAENKLYVAGWTSPRVNVIDCATDSVIKVLSPSVGEQSHLYYNAIHNKVYLTSGAGVYVIDCATDSIVANPVTSAVGPTACYDNLRDQVYVGTSSNENSLIVLDASTDTVVRWIALPRLSGPLCLLYDARFDRVYSMNSNANSISVVNPGTGQVIVTYPTQYHPRAICQDSARRRVYCAIEGDWTPYADAADDNSVRQLTRRPLERLSGGCVAVLDCSTSTIIRFLDVGRGGRALCYSQPGNFVVVANYYDASAMIIDCATDSVRETVTLNGGPKAVCWSSASNKTYCANSFSDNVSVIDGETNRVLKNVLVGDAPALLCYNSTNDRVYCGCGGATRIDVIDCATDSVIDTVETSTIQGAMCYNPRMNRVYCSDGTSVMVINGATNSLIGRVNTGHPTDALCYNPVSNKVYAAHGSAFEVSIVDCSTHAVRAVLPIIGNPRVLCFNPTNNKVYCLSSRNATVIDGEQDRVITALYFGVSPVLSTSLFYDSIQNRIYGTWNYSGVPNGSRLWVCDGAGDTVLRELVLPGAYPRLSSVFFNPHNNKVYCADSYYGVVQVIDGPTMRIVKSVSVPANPEGFAWTSADNRTYVNCLGASQVAVLRDTLTIGINEGGASSRPSRPLQSLNRGVLRIPESTNPRETSRTLLDATGRRVMDLKPGPNDVSRLAPGVYFIIQEGSRGRGSKGSSQKVVIAR